MSVTLADISQRLAERRLVTFFLSRTSRGTWAANARSEGAALVVTAGGATAEEATYAILEAPRLPAAKVKARYFVGEGPDLAVTYNGEAPLRSDGDFREVSAEAWAARRRSLDALAQPVAALRDDFDDLLGL